MRHLVRLSLALLLLLGAPAGFASDDSDREAALQTIAKRFPGDAKILRRATELADERGCAVLSDKRYVGRDSKRLACNLEALVIAMEDTFPGRGFQVFPMCETELGNSYGSARTHLGIVEGPDGRTMIAQCDSHGSIELLASFN